jgi:hypothetical protein
MMKQALENPCWPRRVLGALVAVAIVGGLSGCSITRGGQTADAAASEVKSLPGISNSTDVYSNSAYSGLAKKNATLVVVTFDPDRPTEDMEKLVEYLIRVAWSVNDAKPNMELMVTIKSTAPIDALAAAQGAGWTRAHAFNDERGTVFVPLSEARQRLGDWPGKVPTVPDGLIATSTASPAP